MDFFDLCDGTNGCFIGSTYGFFINATCSFFFRKNAISGKVVKRAGKRQEGAIIPLLALPLMLKVLRKGVTKAGKGGKGPGKGYNSMNYMDKNV